MVNARCRALLVLFVLFAGLVFAHSVFADDVIDVVNVTVPVSCSMSEAVSGNTEHTATIRNNEYESDIGLTNIKVFCNDKDGYSVYAIGYSEDTYGNTEMVYQGNATPAPSNIVTGTATSGNTSNWAMKLSAVEGTYAPTILNGFGSYRTVPSTYTQVATFAAQTDNTIGSTIQSTYAIFVSPTQQAGTYQGKVRYTLVHPNSEVPPTPQATEAGKICYYPNGSNVEGTMGCQTIPESGTTDGVSPTSATLLASNFSRAGYGFAGWSKTFDYSDSTGFLGPQEYIEFTEGAYSGNNSGLSLYAHWVESAGSLQGWTCPNNTTMPVGAVTALTDLRDNETYAVAKLADGNCWMVENLRLENTAEHNSDGALAQGYGTSATYGNFGGLANAESTGISVNYSANSLYSYDGSNDTISIGPDSYPAYRMPRYNNWNNQSASENRPQEPTTTDAVNNTTNAGMYSYGNYYTWAAVIADTAPHASSDTSVSNTSLCPEGWHIPSGGESGEFSILLGFIYSSSQISGSDTFAVNREFRKFPNNYLYSGFYYEASAMRRGSGSIYWSSTTKDELHSYHLVVAEDNFSAGLAYSVKVAGASIRCLSTHSP